MGREEQVRDAKCTRPSLPVEGLAPRLKSAAVQQKPNVTFREVFVSYCYLRMN